MRTEERGALTSPQLSSSYGHDVRRKNGIRLIYGWHTNSDPFTRGEKDKLVATNWKFIDVHGEDEHFSSHRIKGFVIKFGGKEYSPQQFEADVLGRGSSKSWAANIWVTYKAGERTLQLPFGKWYKKMSPRRPVASTKRARLTPHSSPAEMDSDSEPEPEPESESDSEEDYTPTTMHKRVRQFVKQAKAQTTLTVLNVPYGSTDFRKSDTFHGVKLADLIFLTTGDACSLRGVRAHGLLMGNDDLRLFFHKFTAKDALCDLIAPKSTFSENFMYECDDPLQQGIIIKVFEKTSSESGRYQWLLYDPVVAEVKKFVGFSASGAFMGLLPDLFVGANRLSSIVALGTYMRAAEKNRSNFVASWNELVEGAEVYSNKSLPAVSTPLPSASTCTDTMFERLCQSKTTSGRTLGVPLKSAIWDLVWQVYTTARLRPIQEGFTMSNIISRASFDVNESQKHEIASHMRWLLIKSKLIPY